MGNGILVLCEHDHGTFKKTAAELLGKATALGVGPVNAVVVGDADGASLGAYGAGTVYTLPDIGDYNTGKMVAALQAAVAAADPAIVLAPASPDAKDAFPRLSARLGAGMASEVTSLENRGGTVVGRRPQYAGKAFSDVSISSALAIITVRPNSFPAPEAGGGSATVQAVSVDYAGTDLGLSVVDRVESTSNVVDLTEADRIVAGGRSVKSKEGFDTLVRPLAAAIGATPGASRAAVDAGYAPHSTQVGQTGKVVNPSLYIALGISGAIQHLAGMRTSKVIVAINKDAEAPIFAHTTYGIVADMFEVGPALQAEFEAL